MRGVDFIVPATMLNVAAVSFVIVSVWSTPKNPNNHARQLKRVVDNCTTHRRMLEAAKKSADSE